MWCPRSIAIVVLLATLPALAHSFRLGEIEIGHPWAPPSTATEAAVYLALSNRGDTADQLIAASSPRSKAIELRGSDEAAVTAIALEPKRPLALRPGKPHLALLGLSKPLALGEEFPLILRFAGAGTIEVTVTVEAAPGH